MAQRSGWDGSFLSPIDGLPMEGVKCTVKYLNGSDAVVYSSKTGGSIIPTDFETSDNGVFSFYANPGSYVINAVDTHLPKRFTDRYIPFDAVAGDVAGIAGEQVDGIQGKNIDFTSELANKVASGDMRIRIHSISGNGNGGFDPNYVIASQSIPSGVYIFNGTIKTISFPTISISDDADIHGTINSEGALHVFNYIFIVKSGTSTIRIKGAGAGSAVGQLFGFDA